QKLFVWYDTKCWGQSPFLGWFWSRPINLLFGQHEADITFTLIEALPTDQERVRLCPRVLPALRTGEFHLACFLRFPLLVYRSRLPMELKPCRSQLCICRRVAATGDKVMADRLASFLSTLLTGAGGL